MVKCPGCGSSRNWRLGDGRRKCRACGQRFRKRTGWQASRLSSRVKTELVQRFVWGVPVYRQRFGDLVSRPATERFYRLLRACMAHAEQLRAPFDGALECDETTFGGARNGLVKAQPIPQHDRASVMQLIEAHSREGSLYYTDEWQAYATLRLRGQHVVIRKEKGRPVGRHHINGIEGFWSYAKNWLYPYRGVPTNRFHLYLGEICYRFNHRDEDIKPLLTKMLKTIDADELAAILVQNR